MYLHRQLHHPGARMWDFPWFLAGIRVLPGELIFVAEFPPTTGLTPDAESFCSRRFIFSACHATTCDESLRRENSLAVSRERRPAHL